MVHVYCREREKRGGKWAWKARAGPLNVSTSASLFVDAQRETGTFVRLQAPSSEFEPTKDGKTVSHVALFNVWHALSGSEHP